MIGMNAKRKARIVVKVARFKNAVRFGLRICELDSPYLLRPGISAINRKSNGQIDFIGTKGVSMPLIPYSFSVEKAIL